MVNKSLEADILNLKQCSRKELQNKWVTLHNCTPPKRLSTQIMIHAIACEIQIPYSDPLNPITIKYLKKVAESSNIKDTKASATSPPSGTRLIRVWNGVTHIVDVTDDGFEWQGNICKSLSAIAYKITGTHWSGPRFFKLPKKITS